MTGGQPNPGIPVDGMGDEAPAISIEDIVEAIGVKFLKIVNPHNIRKTVDIYKDALEYSAKDWKKLVILGVICLFSFST